MREMICAASLPRPFRITRSGVLRALLALLDDADGAFRSGKGLVTCQEGRSTCDLLAQQHRAEVAVAQTDLAVVGDRAVDAECLQAFADNTGCLRRGLARRA